jgi:hydrogenase expression/formation protein HypD
MTPDVESLVEEIHTLARRIARPIQLMEVCGTHTVSIFRHGLRALMPGNLRLVSGPGCPVCVTAQRHIDAAIEFTRQPEVIVATYGDMVRVPGHIGSLERRRAEGADVRVVGSARSVLEMARKHPDKTVVLVAVGFETTAPATAAVILEAHQQGIENFAVLPAHKLVVPALMALLQAGDVPLDGFLCPGHVSVIIGSEAYRPIIERHAVPCVIAGFEPKGILTAIVALLGQIEEGCACIENPYCVAVSPGGNRVAMTLLDEVFQVGDAPWRALGVIPQSGLDIRPEYAAFDALRRFDVEVGADVDHPACRCGEIIQGKVTPDECTLFGGVCTPLNPLGPCMVSSEGTCSAWYKYNRTEHHPRLAIPSPKGTDFLVM